MHAHQLCEIIEKISLSLYEAALKKIESSDYYFYHFFVSEKTDPHLKGLLDALTSDLNVNLNAFNHVDEVEAFYIEFSKEISALNEGLIITSAHQRFIHSYCEKQNINILNYRSKINYLLDYAYACAMFSIIKFILIQFSEKDTAENFAIATSALNNIYDEKIKGPSDIQSTKVRNAMHGLSIICNRTAKKLIEKGYAVKKWELVATELRTNQDKTADSIEKWITCLPAEYAKSVNVGNGGTPQFLNFESNVKRAQFLAELASVKGDTIKLINCRAKSQAKAIRIRDVLAAINKKFNRRLLVLEGLISKISDSHQHIESQECVSLYLSNHLLDIKSNIQYLYGLLDREQRRCSDILPGIMFILELEVLDQMVEDDKSLLITFSNDFMCFLQEYKTHFDSVDQFQENVSKLTAVKDQRVETRLQLFQHIEAIRNFWSTCANQLTSIAESYLTIATHIQPSFSLTETISNYWPLILLSMVLSVIISALIGILALSLWSISLIVFIAASAAAVSTVTFGLGVFIDYFKQQQTENMSSEQVSALLGPLPNQPQIPLSPLIEPDFGAENEYELEVMPKKTKLYTHFSIWADMDASFSTRAIEQGSPHNARQANAF